MRLLFISDRVPYPPVSGNLLRTYHLCRRLAAMHEVWLAVPLTDPGQVEGVIHMQNFCHATLAPFKHRQSRIQHIPGLLKYALEAKPLEYKFEHSEELSRQIYESTAAVPFDVVHIEPSYMGLYLEALSRSSKAKTSITFHNIESKLFRQLAKVYQSPLAKSRAWLHSLMLGHWESTYVQRFDYAITVSEHERSQLLAANPKLNVVVFPNGVDTQQMQALPPPTSKASLVFVGSMNYAACADAMVYFCQQILPRIQEVAKEVELWIVGRNPTPEVLNLASDQVHVTGAVDAVEPYYFQSTVCVVPLRAGAGTRLKILEAMALGRPVVSTSKGCEGLCVEDGEHLLIADTPELFARRTIELLTDPDLRQRIVEQARELVVQRYDWNVIAHDLSRFYMEQVENQLPAPAMS